MKTIEEIRNFFAEDIYATETTGIEILEAADGYAKVGLQLDRRHMNAANRVMGAVFYTMADFAFAVACNSDTTDGPLTVTLSSQINFLSGVRGTRLYAEARVLKEGRRTSFYSIEIRDDLNTLVATVSSNGYRIYRD